MKRWSDPENVECHAQGVIKMARTYVMQCSSCGEAEICHGHEALEDFIHRHLETFRHEQVIGDPIEEVIT